MAMKRQLPRAVLSIIAATVWTSGLACTDWSRHENWPQQYKFQGRLVQLYRTYLTGDFDAENVQPGQQPAMFHTYYAYIKAGQQVRHGKSTWWYAAEKPKAEVIYVHDRKTDRTTWYPSGVIAEQVKTCEDGERSEFFDKTGRLLGNQLDDKNTGKLTCILRGKTVTLDEFMAEISRVVYERTRITP